MKKSILFIIIFILSVSFIAAAPPSTQVFVGGEKGLEIKYPIVYVGRINTQMYPAFHVFNKSNGYNFREGDNINCTMHIYAPNAKHIYTNWSNTWDHDFDIEFNIPPTLFNTIGIYSYIVQCENLDNNEGGFVSSSMMITPTGRDEPDKTLYLTLVIIILGVIITLLLLTDKIEFFFFENSDGEQIPIMKYLVWLVSGWLLLPLINIGIRALEFVDIGLSNTFNVLFKSVLWILIFISMIWVIGFLMAVLQKFGESGDDLV